MRRAKNRKALARQFLDPFNDNHGGCCQIKKLRTARTSNYAPFGKQNRTRYKTASMHSCTRIPTQLCYAVHFTSARTQNDFRLRSVISEPVQHTPGLRRRDITNSALIQTLVDKS